MEVTLYVVVLAVFVACAFAYIANIYKLACSKEVTGKVLARVCGIFVVPLGVVMGFVS